MERRAFLQFLCVGMGLASVATPATAFTLLAQPAANGPEGSPAPEPSVATKEDVDGAQVEKVYYGHYRRVRRRTYRRHVRRVNRRFVRRHLL